MLTGEIRNQVDNLWNAFWTGGISNPLTVIEQITYLIFIKRLDEIQTLKEIERIEALLPSIDDENEKYRYVRKMNSLVTEFNLMRNTSVNLEKKQYYFNKLTDRFDKS